MPILDSRQYRAMTITPTATQPEAERQQLIESKYYVEGYAARFEPYLYYEDKNGAIYEQFLRSAFDNCDMSDVIFLYNHEGRVLARQSNNSLVVKIDDVGILTGTDLGRTEAARQIYDDIVSGMVTKMSWSFNPGQYDRDYYFDREKRTLIHINVPKMYDVSAVSIPANDTTSIMARAFFDGAIEECLRRDRALEDRRRLLRMKIKLLNEIKEF